ncbi:hypothetical protein AFLA70_125g002351 [Aspergillus flavus AF70]|nr:hypothetical protein AFLA70_125g002351 [Aspergillus flavus AF70]
MSNANFRLESSRPWNPFQDKAHTPQDSLGIHRYPSPISIAATPPPSNLSDPALKSPEFHSNKSERHPLPARPPVEVCLDGGLHSVVQTTLHKPEDLARAASASPRAETFDPDGILQVHDLPDSEDLGSATITGNICLGAERRSTGFGPRDLELAVIAAKHPQGLDSGNHILTRALQDFETIDPVILNDHAFPGGGQIQATEIITGIAECPGKCPSECSGFPGQDSPLKCRQHHAERTESPGRQFSKLYI